MRILAFLQPAMARGPLGWAWDHQVPRPQLCHPSWRDVSTLAFTSVFRAIAFVIATVVRRAIAKTGAGALSARSDVSKV